MKSQTRSAVRRKEKSFRITWLEWLLIAATAGLVLQLVPAIATTVLSYVDVRGWTWRSYAATCTIAIVMLVAARSWQENSHESG